MATASDVSRADRPALTLRQKILAGFFLGLGLIVLFGYAPFVGADEPEISRLTFGVGAEAFALDVPTVATMLLIGLVFSVTGALTFSGRVAQYANVLLTISGALLIPAVLIAAAAGKQTNVITMLSETLRLSTPLVLGALAGIFAERAGVVNIAIEGMMLFGAAFGFAAFAFTGNIWLGVVVAILVGGMASMLHAVLSIRFMTDQIISGTVVNILAIGITAYLRRTYLVDLPGGRTTLPQIQLPLLSDIPLIGAVLFNNKPIFFMMVLLVPLAHLVLFHTRWGLRMRAVGENPRAADTVGINVFRVRYFNLAISGLLAGLAGAWFSLETVGNFDDGMTAGKGFIALAAMIFGKWTPFGALAGALLFGFTEALGTRFQLLQVAIYGWPVPVQWLQILPYVTTMVVLAGLIGRATPPAAIGQPYEK